MLPSEVQNVHFPVDSDSPSCIDAEYQEPRLKRPKSLLGRIVFAFGMTNPRRREARSGYLSGWRDESVDELLEKKSPVRAKQKSRQPHTFGGVKKALLFLPAVVLSILCVPTCDDVIKTLLIDIG